MKRNRLPDTRNSITHKGNVGGTEFYLTVGMFEDNTPGELFIVIGKEGSTIAGWADGFSRAISLLLQSDWPIDKLIAKFGGSTFEPRGYNKNPEIDFESKSIIDYIFQWLIVIFDATTSKIRPEYMPTIQIKDKDV